MYLDCLCKIFQCSLLEVVFKCLSASKTHAITKSVKITRKDVNLFTAY